MIVEDPTKVDGFHLPKIDCAEGFRADYRNLLVTSYTVL
jgi:hypothetical protein